MIIEYLVAINIITLLAFIIDKRNAIKHKYRISEKLLFFLVIIGGALGSLVGIFVFRHKSKKIRFVVGVLLIIIIEIIIIFSFVL